MSKVFKSVSIRVPAELHERATAKCRKQKRSFNDVAINALQRWVDEGADLAEGALDFTALEERIMARFDKLEKATELYAIQEITIDTESMTPEQLHQLKMAMETQILTQYVDPPFGQDTSFAGRIRGFHTGGYTSDARLNNNAIPAILEKGEAHPAHADMAVRETQRVRDNREYFSEGCECNLRIPVPITDAEAVAFYEANCTCTRNYKHLEKGES